MKQIKHKSIVGKSKPLTPAQLNKYQKGKVSKVKIISSAKLRTLVREFSGDSALSIPGTPLMELTPRHPYDALGLMDVYRPGRWDCTYDLLYMHTIVQGNSVGEWEGTVAYLNFKATQSGTYLIVGNFSGYQITMRLNGPWGNNTAYNATNQDSGTVLALWNGSANQKVFFTMNCITKNNGHGLGYLKSVQVYLL